MDGNRVPTGKTPARMSALVSSAIPRMVLSAIFSASQDAVKILLKIFAFKCSIT
jgi:hypothetical protein